MKLALMTAFALLFAFSLCHGAEQTIPYTTSGAEPTGYDDVMSLNPYCPEWMKSYEPYSRLKTDKCGEPGRRVRVWKCILTGKEGADVEHIPAVPCGSE